MRLGSSPPASHDTAAIVKPDHPIVWSFWRRFAGQHVDRDDVVCVMLCLWLGNPGEMPRSGGEWVMSGIGLAQELAEFDVFLFDPRRVHSFAKLWGDGCETGLRTTVSLYVPNNILQRVKGLVS